MAEGTEHEEPGVEALEVPPEEVGAESIDEPEALVVPTVETEVDDTPAPAEPETADELASADEAESEEPATPEQPAPTAAAPEETSADDVAAAIAAAGESIEAEPTLDDIAPGTVVADPDAADAGAAALAPDPNVVSVWPFVGYFGVWVAFAIALVWQLRALPAEQAVYDSSLYAFAILGGVLLTLAGPLLILVVWFASWGQPGSSKGALLVSALVRGAIATTAGVVLWWLALMVLDYIRLGRLL